MTRGRVKVRQEGEWLRAYYAPIDTMEGAKEVCCMLAGAHQETRDLFRTVAQRIVDDMIEDATGRRPRK